MVLINKINLLNYFSNNLIIRYIKLIKIVFYIIFFNKLCILIQKLVVNFIVIVAILNKNDWLSQQFNIKNKIIKSLIFYKEMTCFIINFKKKIA